MYLTVGIVSSDLRKILLAPDLLERNYCVSRRVSVLWSCTYVFELCKSFNKAI
jgi:hypothetical protein